MTIEVTKKQNIRIDGVKYKAVASDGTCMGCDLYEGSCFAVPCVPPDRMDSRHVIFVRKEPEWTPVNGIKPVLDPLAKIEWKNRLGHSMSTTAGELCWNIGSANEVTHYRILKSSK
jgi:hypothetical protein